MKFYEEGTFGEADEVIKDEFPESSASGHYVLPGINFDEFTAARRGIKTNMIGTRI